MEFSVCPQRYRASCVKIGDMAWRTADPGCPPRQNGEIMGDRFRKVLIIIGCVIIFAGVLGLLYPFVGSYINSLGQQADVQEYRQQAASLNDEEARRYIEEAHEYNRRLFARGKSMAVLNEEQIEEYNGVLDMYATGIMGYLEIPKINLSLPIYHGTEEEALQEGVGHLEGSSFPVGGEDTHAVLTGHSGLPDSELFTKLDMLEVGDTFTVTVLTNTVTYEVYDISTVLPEDAVLEFTAGRDFCTLVTCRPIGLNTHRLLVRGARVDEDSAPGEED